MKSLSIVRVAVACASLSLWGDAATAQSAAATDRRQQAKALGSGGLREAAAVTGSFVQELPAAEVLIKDIHTLTRGSAIVVRGRFGQNRAWLDETGRVITTQYEFTVLESARGGFREGEEIAVAITGGRVEFDNGTWAETRTAGHPLPGPGQEAILFLKPGQFRPTPAQRQAARGPLYTLTVHGQSMFVVGPKGTLLSYMGPTHPLAKAFSNKRPEDLMGAVRKGG
jgi:hypothetical protein